MLDYHTTNSRSNNTEPQTPTATRAHRERGGARGNEWLTDWWMPPPVTADSVPGASPTPRDHPVAEAVEGRTTPPTRSDALSTTPVDRATRLVDRATTTVDRRTEAGGPLTVAVDRRTTIVEPSTTSVEPFAGVVDRRTDSVHGSASTADHPNLAQALRGGLDHASPYPPFRPPLVGDRVQFPARAMDHTFTHR